MPGWARWARLYQTYRQLYPLWRATYGARAELQLFAPPGPFEDALTVRFLPERLRERIAGIREAERVLRPHFNQRVADAARRLGSQAGLDGAELAAVVMAANLVSALYKTRYRLLLPDPGDPTDPAASSAASELAAYADVDMGLEVAELERVAGAYTSSPIVARALAEAGVPDIRHSPML